MTPLEGAIRYTSHGWRIVPAPRGAKRPVLPGWQNLATSDQAGVCVHWAQYPDDNICIATGQASNLWVLDIDDKDGATGSATLAALERQYGDLPRTYAVGTGSGGVHYYWTWDGVDFDLRNSAGRLGNGLDTRGNGGQVVAPPSVSESGAYVVLELLPVVAAPPWLILLLRPQAYSGRPEPRHTQPPATGALFAQPGVAFGDEYADKAVTAECDSIRCAPEGGGNARVNEACFSLGTLVTAPWNSLTLEQAEEAVYEALGTWTRINQGIYKTMRHALDDGMRQPRPRPASNTAPALGRPQLSRPVYRAVF